MRCLSVPALIIFGILALSLPLSLSLYSQTNQGGGGSGGGGGGGVSSFSGDGTLLSNSASTGAVTATLANAAQNSVFAGPASGGAGAPTFQTAPNIAVTNMTGTGGFSITGNAATATLATTATNIAGGAANTWPIQTGVATTGFDTTNIYYNATAGPGSTPTFQFGPRGSNPIDDNFGFYYSTAGSGFHVHNVNTTPGPGIVQVNSAPLTAMVSGNILGKFQFAGAYDTSQDEAVGAAIKATATQTFTGSVNGTSMTFQTTPNNSSTLTMALFLDQNQVATLAQPPIVPLTGYLYGNGSGAVTASTGLGTPASGVITNLTGTCTSCVASSISPTATIGTQNTTAAALTLAGSSSAGASLVLNGDGASPGSSTISVNTAGTTLNLGSTNVTVDNSGDLFFSSGQISSNNQMAWLGTSTYHGLWLKNTQGNFFGFGTSASTATAAMYNPDVVAGGPSNVAFSFGLPQSTTNWDQSGMLLFNTAEANEILVTPLAAPTWNATPYTTASTGGSIHPGTYYYKVVTFDVSGFNSAPSTELTVTVPAGTNTNTVTLNWTPNPSYISNTLGAASFKVYGRASSGGEAFIATVTTPTTTTYTDNGSISPSGAIPTSNTSGNIAATFFLTNTLFSAASTALPTCASGINGARAVVSDATAPLYMTAYTSGGGVTAEVICSYNGSSYAWLTH